MNKIYWKWQLLPRLWRLWVGNREEVRKGLFSEVHWLFNAVDEDDDDGGGDDDVAGDGVAAGGDGGE